jgi:phage/plasmid-associated DNA primase
MREFEDKHNVEIKGRKLIYINEMCPVGEKSSIIASDFDRMKAFITDPIIKERGMYREAITFKNYSNVIMCSNHPTSIKIETNDRRYVCLETSNIKCNNPGESTHNKYWESVHKEIDNQAYADNFYSWIISLDSKELGNPRIPINTDLKQSIAEVNECNVFSFYKHIKERREEVIFEAMGSAYLESTEEPLTCQVEYKAIELYNMYREWCTDEGISYQIKSNKFFSIAMKKFMAWKKKKDAAYWYFLEDQSSEKVEEIPPIGLPKLDLSVIAGGMSSVQPRDDNLLN